MSQFANQTVGCQRPSALVESSHQFDDMHDDSEWHPRATARVRAEATYWEEDHPVLNIIAKQPLSFLAGLALAVFAAAALHAPMVPSIHAPMQHLATWAGQGLDLFRTRIALAEPDQRLAARKPSFTDHQPIQIVADRASAPVSQPAPRLLTGSAVEGPLATMLPVPLEIANADRLDRDSVLLVTNVPDNAALSQGQPLGAGTWIVPAQKVANLGIIAYAQPLSKQRIAFELLSGEGALISTANAFLNIAEPERTDRMPTSVTSAPGLQRLSQMAESALGHRRR